MVQTAGRMRREQRKDPLLRIFLTCEDGLCVGVYVAVCWSVMDCEHDLSKEGLAQHCI